MKNIISVIIAAIYCFFPQYVSLSETNGANTGSSFWFTVPPGISDGESDMPVKIFVACDRICDVTLEIESKNYKEIKKTIPFGVIQFELSAGEAQCYELNNPYNPLPDSVFTESGIHIFADSPIAVYCMFMNNMYGEGFNVIPVEKSGREYNICSYNSSAYEQDIFPGFACIVAIYDKTKAAFTMGGCDSSITSGGMKPGDIASKILNRGDVWLIATKNSGGDLSGSQIWATKPVAVISGSSLAQIPIKNGSPNYLAEMESPIYTWGTNYLIPVIKDRKHAPLLRIFARDSNTVIYRDGVKAGFIPFQKGKINEGYLEMRALPLDSAPRPVVISADKHIAVSLYNTGAEDGEDSINTGIPFISSMTAKEQFLKEIMIVNPDISMGADTSRHYVNIIYESDAEGNVPDNMEFGYWLDGELFWKPLKGEFPEPGEVFNYSPDGKSYASKIIYLPEPGVFMIRNISPFTAYSYGFSGNRAYGMPTCFNAFLPERHDTVPPVPKYSSECKRISDATVTDMPDEDEVRSNLGSILFHKDSSYNMEFNYQKFEVGFDRSTLWGCEVIETFKASKGVITFSDRAGNDTTITIEYKPWEASLAPNEIDFGVIKPGETAEKEYKIYTYHEGPVLIDTLCLEKECPENIIDGERFDLLGVNLPFTLPPDDSLTLRVRFTAKDTGKFYDAIHINKGCYIHNIVQLSAKVSKSENVSGGVAGYSRVIYPNPAENELFIDCGHLFSEPVRIKISNASGDFLILKTIKSVNADKIRMDISTIPNGIYFIELISGDKIFREKFAVIR